MNGLPAGYIFPVRSERCASCLYRLAYDQRTRRRVLDEVATNDSYVRCHCHDPALGVCCRGYWDAVGESGGTPVQIAIRLERLLLSEGRPSPILYVRPGEYPDLGEDEDEDW